MSRCRLHYWLLKVICGGVFAALTTAPVVQANVFNMPAGETSLQFVNVGDPGNVADTAVMNTSSEDILNINGSPDHSTGYGAVSFNYAMGTCDVTTAQYVQFLNAVATTSDPYGLYNPLAGGATSGPASSDPKDPIGTTAAWVTISSGGKTWPVVCGITRTGTAGNYHYAPSTSAASNLGSPPIPADNGNFPVNWDNWGDAARFCNWLQNGQPTGAEGPGTTETGAYTLNGATTVAQLFNVKQNSGAKYWIPTENEWYKVAYYKSGGTNAGYWTYTTKSNTAPSSALSTTGTNNANFNSSGLQAPNNWILTPVGYYAVSPGPYGTYDVGGDLYEFTSTPVTQSSDGTGEGLDVYVMRGGSFHKTSAMELDSNYRTGADPAKYGHGRTFRIATTFTTAQWSGLTAGGNWSTMTNWSGDAAPSAGIALQFGAVSKGGSVTNYNNFTAGTAFNGIAFASAAPSYNLQGNAISLAGAIQNASRNSQAVGLNIALVAGGGTLDSGAAGLTVSGTISGANPLTKIGSGTLILSGSNAYSGGTTISNGTLAATNVNSLGAASGSLSIGPATLEVAGTFADGRNISLTDPGATIQVDPSFVYGNSGTLSGIGGLSLTGSGTLILSGSNTYSGGTMVDAGILIIANNTAMADGSGLTVDAGGTFIFDPSMAGAVPVASTVVAVPEPPTGSLLGVSAIGLIAYRWRRRMRIVA